MNSTDKTEERKIRDLVKKFQRRWKKFQDNWTDGTWNQYNKIRANCDKSDISFLSTHDGTFPQLAKIDSYIESIPDVEVLMSDSRKNLSLESKNGRSCIDCLIF